MNAAEECVFGHKTHDRIQMGLWTGYAWSTYLDQPAGWCQGRCDISRTLDLYGVWEWADTKRFMKALRERPCDGEQVIDLGANIGWYTVWAALCGFEVLAVEGIDETTAIMWANTVAFGVSGLVHPRCAWIDGETPQVTELQPVRLMKIDIEGLEPEAVRVYAPLFEQRLVEHAVIEVSPVFKEYTDSTTAMVRQLLEWGYRADVGGVPFDADSLRRIDQANVWFRRKR